MSSTNRGYERHKTDCYVTPKKCIKDFLSAWLYDLEQEEEYNVVSARPDKVAWLDPCAGGDKTHGTSYPEVLEELFGVTCKTNDIREDSRAQFHTDYLTTDFKGADVIITNPPFYIAKEIILKALKDVERGGYVVMLVRLNFLGSKARKAFFDDNMPQRIYVHNRRMSFTDDGKTDSIEYAHMVWKKGNESKKAITRII